MAIETERKFLLRPADVVRFVPPDADRFQIEQAYVVSGPQGALRVRRKRAGGKDAYLLTCKGPKVDGSAEEIEFEIPRERYAALAASLTGRLVRKTRFVVSLNGHTAEIDLFEGPLEPLCMAEVEGPDCASFVPPSWFGREVTGDSRYDNGALALASDLPPLA
jgi:CYTH domain-containing protein